VNTITVQAMETILTVNIGSASKKYALYQGGDLLCRAHVESEDNTFQATFFHEHDKEVLRLSPDEYQNTVTIVLGKFIALGFITTPSDIDAIGIRIVAPGTYFAEHKNIDETYLRNLVSVEEYAPLHITPAREEIDRIHHTLPDIPLISVSDSAFHSHLPPQARRYSVRKSDAEAIDMYRFGYHGISIESLVEKIRANGEPLPERIIVCHLGGGASITAVKNGTSVDTSMGATPLSGLLMNTRAGEIDAGATLYFAKKTGRSIEDIEDYLNTECGLLGITEKTGDVRELLEGEGRGDAESALALEMFAYNVKKYIGAYTSALNGLDLLVLSGTISERSNVMREKICSNMEYLNIVLDKEKNSAVGNITDDAFIHQDTSSVRVAVMKTDESAQMARSVQAIVG
jgi:acetate kinase